MSYAPQIVAMLAGGLVPSLGLTYLARSARGRALVGALRPVTLVVGAVVVTGACGAVAWLTARQVLGAVQGVGGGGGGPSLPAPGVFLLFGLAVGFFLAVPGVVLAWLDERTRARERSKRKDHVPSKDERRAFAEDLARQIRELSVPRREVEVSVGGDGDRVLLIRGALEAEEGEKLTAALRADLQYLGFKRVEGSGGAKEWWARV